MTLEQIGALALGGIVWDDKVRGLHVRAMAGGRRVYYLYFRTKLRRERRPMLGDVGTITLTQAREIARKMLQEVASGTDPVEVRQQHREALTVADLWDKYKGSKDAPQKTIVAYERIYTRYIKPALGRHRITTVSREDIERIFDSLASRPFQANRLVAVAGSLFAYAERQKMLHGRDNPAHGIRRNATVSRERYASPEEARALLTALATHSKENPRAVGFILLCLFTGARPDEIARARPEWIQGTALRLADSKTGRRTIHLSPQALDIISWLRPYADGTITGLRRSPKRVWEKVRTAAGCPDLRLYDLRHTFASAAIAATGSLDKTGLMLGHTKQDTTRIYAHLMKQEGADAATATSAFIEEKLLGGPLGLLNPVAPQEKLLGAAEE